MRIIYNLFLLLLISFFTKDLSAQEQILFEDHNGAKRVSHVVKRGADGQSSTNDEGHQHNGEKCQQSHKDRWLGATKPGYDQVRSSAKQLSLRMEEEIRTGNRATPPVYTIPIVFHVIHKGENIGNGTNISDAQLMSSIDALNRDYRRTNADGGIAQGAGPDTEIQFCLASVDESGNPHSGINRVNGTSVPGYSGSGITNSNETAVKDLSRWDNRYYLNIWVVSEIDNNGADVSNPASFNGGTLGYAYLPVNPVTWNSDLDGIVALNLCVGNDPNQTNGYRLWPWGSLTNRTVTHEVGHFLDLHHPFEGNSCSESNCATQGDEVCDTPPTVNGSTCNVPACSGAIVENYMDYTSETCQDMFTSGQTTRMRAALAGVRNALVNTTNCVASGNDWDASVSAIVSPIGIICATSLSPQVTLSNYGGNTLTSVNIQYGVDGVFSTYTWNGTLASGASTNVTLPVVTTTAGPHNFTASSVSGSLNGSNVDDDTSNDGSNSSFTVSGSGSSVTLTLDLDCYGEEITWEIVDENNNTVESGGPYVNNTNGEQHVYNFCLAEGCYDFNINDTYGDGLYGSQWTCTIDGDYNIDGSSGNLVSMTAPNGDFGFGTTHNFCLGTPPPPNDCDSLVYFNGAGFMINDNDSAAFDALLIDNDQEAVATTLFNLGYISNWDIYYEAPVPGDTNLLIRATSWHADATAPADNWLTFGPITIPAGGADLSWNHRMPNNQYRDGYRVLLGTSGIEVADFNGATTLYSVTDNDPSTNGDTVWTAKAINLPASMYAGQSIYLAFHHNALDMLFLDLDEIYMEGCSSTPVTVKESFKGIQLAMFPNPNSGQFTVNYATESNLNRMIITDGLGRTVASRALNGAVGSAKVDLSNVADGVYTLSVMGEKQLKTVRIVVQR